MCGPDDLVLEEFEKCLIANVGVLAPAISFVKATLLKWKHFFSILLMGLI